MNATITEMNTNLFTVNTVRYKRKSLIVLYFNLSICTNLNTSLSFLQRMFRELKKKRDQWIKSEPWLPQLEDVVLSRMKSFITDCVRIAWRMVNLLPPLKIMLTSEVARERFDDYFHTEKEEVKEKTLTDTLCVWPALTDCDGNEVLFKGTVVIIPKAKRRQEQLV